MWCMNSYQDGERLKQAELSHFPVPHQTFWSECYGEKTEDMIHWVEGDIECILKLIMEEASMLVSPSPQ